MLSDRLVRHILGFCCGDPKGAAANRILTDNNFICGKARTGFFL